jgi:charged multivesicular body protein 4
VACAYILKPLRGATDSSNRSADEVDETMAAITEQRQVVNYSEITELRISNPTGMGLTGDVSGVVLAHLSILKAQPQAEIMDELHALENEILTEQLAGAAHLPIHTPASAVRVESE